MPPYRIAQSSEPDAPSVEESTLRLARRRVDEWREQGACPVITDVASARALSAAEIAGDEPGTRDDE